MIYEFPNFIIEYLFFFLILRINFCEKAKLWLEILMTKHFQTVHEKQIVSWM